MRACACDTAARLCVRTVLCSSAFSWVPSLRSTNSAAAEAALFARFFATSGRSDFSIALIVGYGLRPSRQRPGHDWRGRRWRAPGSRAKGFCACQGLRRRGVGVCLAISTPAVLPSVGRKTSAPRTCLTPLNTSPAPSPVNASRLPSRTTRASLGASAVRSGRTEARTGLQMMPTSPRSPLSFRTAGFPQYGWKAGLSDGAFLVCRSAQACSRHALFVIQFASVLRALRGRIDGTALSRARGLDCAPP